MTMSRGFRCLLALAVAGIVACGGDKPAGPDLTAPASIVVAPDSLRLLVDDTARLRVVVLNVKGDTLTAAPVVFSSSDSAVATVDAVGLVRGVSGGVSDVSVRSGDVTTTVRTRIRVNGTLTVSPHTSLVTQRDTLQLSVVVRDSNGVVIPGASVRYQSLDTTIVRVSGTGRVTFAGAAGSTRIDIVSSGRRDAVFATALVDRVPLSAGLIDVREDGNAFLLGGQSLLRFQLPSTALAEQWYIPYDGSIRDGAVNTVRSKAWISDGYFGNLVAMDLPSGAIDTVARSTTFPNPYGPLEPTLAPGDSVLYYFADSFIYGLRLATNTKIDSVEIVGWQLAVRDSLLYALWPVRGEIQEYNVLRRTRGRLIKLGWEISDFSFSRDGIWLYAVHGSSQALRLFLWNRVTGDTLPSIELPGPNPYADGATVAQQPSTGYVWVSANNAARVYVVDVQGRKVVRTLQPGGQPRGMGFAASGLGLLANESGWVDFIR